MRKLTCPLHGYIDQVLEGFSSLRGLVLGFSIVLTESHCIFCCECDFILSICGRWASWLRTIVSDDRNHILLVPNSRTFYSKRNNAEKGILDEASKYQAWTFSFAKGRHNTFKCDGNSQTVGDIDRYENLHHCLSSWKCRGVYPDSSSQDICIETIARVLN